MAVPMESARWINETARRALTKFPFCKAHRHVAATPWMRFRRCGSGSGAGASGRNGSSEQPEGRGGPHGIDAGFTVPPALVASVKETTHEFVSNLL